MTTHQDLTKAFMFKDQTVLIRPNELDKWWSIETRTTWGAPTGEVKYLKITSEQAKHLKTNNDKGFRYIVPYSYLQDSMNIQASNVLQETTSDVSVSYHHHTEQKVIVNTPQTAKQDELVDPIVLKEFIIASISHEGTSNTLQNFKTIVQLAKEYHEHVS